MNNLILTGSLALLAGFACPFPLLGSEAVLTDDTTANRAFPRTFYHTQPRLGVAASGQGIGRTAFLKFDFSNLPPGTPSSQISKATLRLYCNAVTKPGLVDIVPVTAHQAAAGWVRGERLPAFRFTAVLCVRR